MSHFDPRLEIRDGFALRCSACKGTQLWAFSVFNHGEVSKGDFDFALLAWQQWLRFGWG